MKAQQFDQLAAFNLISQAAEIDSSRALAPSTLVEITNTVGTLASASINLDAVSNHLQAFAQTASLQDALNACWALAGAVSINLRSFKSDTTLGRQVAFDYAGLQNAIKTIESQMA